MVDWENKTPEERQQERQKLVASIHVDGMEIIDIYRQIILEQCATIDMLKDTINLQEANLKHYYALVEALYSENQKLKENICGTSGS